MASINDFWRQQRGLLRCLSIEEREEKARVVSVIARGTQDDEPPPNENILAPEFFSLDWRPHDRR